MAWAWDKAAARYRDTDTGKFMPRQQVLDYVEASIGNGQPAMDQLAAYVANGTLSPADWHAAMQTEIKQEYIRQGLLGAGGRNQMTPSMWGTLGNQIKDQYKYLDRFAGEVGNLSEAQIAARSKMYMNAAREAYEKMNEVANKKAGNDEELWALGMTEHCPDCLAFAAEGWQEIGYFPPPGSGATVCLTNCGCHKEYRSSKEAA